MDIIAEEVADHPELRDTIRHDMQQTVSLTAKPTKTFEEN
jgi:transcriptional accessory protein Tex/SPT6